MKRSPFQFLTAALLQGLLFSFLAANDTVSVQPAEPTDKDSLTFHLRLDDHCCVSRFLDQTVYVEDSSITLSYSVSDSNCDKVECLLAGSNADFAAGPLVAGRYGVYKLEIPYCPPGTVCPNYIPLPVKIGQITVLSTLLAEQAPNTANPVITACPNPFNSAVSITFSGPAKKADLMIYNIEGKLVRSFRNAAGNRVSWNAEGLPNGLYVLKARINGATLTRKLVFSR